MTGSGSLTLVERGRERVGGLRDAPLSVAMIVVALAIGAVAVAILEAAGVNDASPAFLLAVVAIAVLRGTGPAVTTAVGAFLVYDFFFIEPYHTFTVHDPGEWLNLLLLLVVGAVVGRLAGRERDRAEAAIDREHEATALFDISFLLATRTDTASALGPVADVVRGQTQSGRTWITVGETLAADTDAAAHAPPSNPAVHSVLRRRPGNEPAEWIRVHAPARGGKPSQASTERAFRVLITAGGETFGSVWTSRPRELGDPDRAETRLLAIAADQLGGVLERDRLHREATAAEISRRSDALKSALLDSVSHDLRTPLASIRAAAGSLMDPDVNWPAAQEREIAAGIDHEAEWLNRLVTNLLDMSRVEAGELRPNLAAFDLHDLIDEAVARTGVGGGEAGRRVEVDVPIDLPPVLVDEVFIGQVLGNTLENAAAYAGPAAAIHVEARPTPDERVRLTIEDAGPGVPDETLPRLFDKFYRVPRKGEGSRRGTGIGLAVVRGLVESMGGAAVARRSAMGGLAIDIDLPIAALDRYEDVPA